MLRLDELVCDSAVTATADGEDEEAFMECLAAEHTADGATLPAVLKIRSCRSPDSQWSDAVLLLSGVHAAGAKTVNASPSKCSHTAPAGHLRSATSQVSV